MKRIRKPAGIALLLLLAALLFGCQHMIDPSMTHVPFMTEEGVPSEGGTGNTDVVDYVRNFPVEDADLELMPLAPGNRWYYRNATADRLPTRQPIREISISIEEKTHILDTQQGKIECFVVVIEEGEAVPARHFWHRSEEGIYEYGVETEGLTVIYTEPLLKIPAFVSAGEQWTYTIADETITSRALLQETVATSMLGIFQQCWRIERADGDGISVEWYKAGHGIVKIVRDSGVFEPILIETETVALGVP